MWRTHSPKQFCQRASCFICQYWKTDHFPQLKVYHGHLATLPLSILLEEQTLARVQCLARAFVKQCSCEALTTVRQPFSPNSFHVRKGSDQWAECLLVESWESLSLADTSNIVSFSGADAALWWPTLVEVSVRGKNEHSMLHCQDFTTEVWHCPEFQIFLKLQEAFLLPVGEWKLLGSGRWRLQRRPFGRCYTAKGKQHLRHKQGMMIHPEWHQRSLSHGAIITLVTT